MNPKDYGTFEEWITEELKDYLPDIASHGADSGFPGITYYKDTIALYDQFADEIWEALTGDADSLGYDNPLALVASFNSTAYSDAQFKNLLVWYMAERVARYATE